MIETQIEIPSRAGRIETFMCRPDKTGPWPGVIFYMDAPGIREELRDMARRIATVGYCVLLPNLYYRQGPGITLSAETAVHDSPERQRMFALMNTLTHQGIAEDTQALLDFIDTQPAIRRGALGAVGYCMSGPFVTVAGTEFPDRFAAIASFYGVGLITDKPDSVHRQLNRLRAEAYYGFGGTDELTPPAEIERFRAALDASGARYALEVYPGAGHGFAFPQRPRYDKPSAERHWERLFELLRRNLG